MGSTKNICPAAAIGLLVCISLSASVFGRASAEYYSTKGFESNMSTVTVAHCLANHDIGQIVLSVNNNGTFGTGFSVAPADCFTGGPAISCEYPKGTNVQYLFAGAFWIGAVVGRDTSVSIGADGWSFQRELFPDEDPFGRMIQRSIIDPEKEEYAGAVSEQDFISVYTDTFTEGIGNDFFGRPHRPLYIEVTQSSYAWSYSYAEDFVLFDYQIRNIGSSKLQNVYMGVYVDADVCFDCDNTHGYADDICGFVRTYPSTCGECEFPDNIVDIAWIADNDGDFNAQMPASGLTATRIVRTPAEVLDVSFNWWISNGASALDFGPRHRDNYRDLRTGGQGTPEGDVNKYYFMSNGEFDYDQARAGSIQPNDTLWLYPDQSRAKDYAQGLDTRYLLSFGPFEIRPGQTLPISLAYVGGENLHSRDHPDNLANLPDNPDQFYENLDFSDLAKNADWAASIYDNPGVDTDGDGYYGSFRTCPSESLIREIDTTIDGHDTTITEVVYTAVDTCWDVGDGVPDYVGAAPPPAPDFWVTPLEGAVLVRFNGLRSETTRDVFSRLYDFEGYRVYIARDDRPSSFGLAASYDHEDYNKHISNGRGGFVIRDVPFGLRELRCLYAESCDDESWHPLDYSRTELFSPPDHPESTFYFTAQDYNASELGVTTPIYKVYPDQPYPSSLIPDSAQPEEVTEDGYLKYFEYEVLIENLLPTVPWYVNVTAFDYGSPESDLEALETSVETGAQYAYPQPSWEEVEEGNLKPYVYPNPYRIDAEYRERGFEGRVDSDRPPDRTRLLHFANLPPRCTIRIYTLDGDLVRQLDHDKDESDPTASHEEWNLITRNTQMVVTGLYYYTVEDESGKVDIGKLAIIM